MSKASLSKTTYIIMKFLIYTLIFLAVALIVLNATMLNFEALFSGNSLIALIGITASLCAILILLIFKTSKETTERFKKK